MTPAPRLVELSAPLSGWALPLGEVPDPVFADRLLGDGIAIDPTDGKVLAPCDGEIVSVAPTAHAVTLRAANGAEILIHVGINTVELKGLGFEVRANAGDRVRAGDLLLCFDLDAVARRAASLVTPVVVTNGEGFEIGQRSVGCTLRHGGFLMRVAATGAAQVPAAAREAGTSSRPVQVELPHGIHARPAALISRKAREFRSTISLVAHGRRADARSSVALMSLGIRARDRIMLEASGSDAADALDALRELLGAAEATGTRVSPEPAACADPAFDAPPPPRAGACLAGIVAAPGSAVGIAAPLSRQERPVARTGAGFDVESANLSGALAQVRSALAARLCDSTGPRREIVAAHLEMLDDPGLAEAAGASLRRGASAGQAWRSAIRSGVQALRDLGDPRLGERADDLIDLETQVLAALAGEPDGVAARLPDRAIVLADQLLPSQLVCLDEARIAGLCTARGGPTSHVAILAAAMGKPMLVGVGRDLLGIRAGTPLLVDADQGIVQVDPPASRAAEFEERARRQRAREAADHEAAAGTCMMTDGGRIHVMANVGSTSDAITAVALGAEGCGLLRTEFMFLDRQSAPDAQAQANEYRKVLDAFDGLPVAIRTLDTGDDKALPYLAQPREANPALGLRGIRSAILEPELLRTQLEAVLSLRDARRCRILLPMVSEPGEIAGVREQMHALAKSMGLSDLPALGAMIETPAAALIADRLCEEADFISIGTNDLTQYTLAIDRAHPELAARLDGLHPAVLRLVRSAAAAAAARGLPVAVCGGLASDPVALPVLVGLGVHEFSLVPSLIPRIKAIGRSLTQSACDALAERSLAQDSAGAVRRLAREALESAP